MSDLQFNVDIRHRRAAYRMSEGTDGADGPTMKTPCASP